MVCRARRTKCDNKKPKCSFCERVGAECVSEAQDFSGFDPASLEIIGRLERIEQALAEKNETWRDVPVFQDVDTTQTRDTAGPLSSRRPSYLRPGDTDALLPQNVQKIVQWPMIAPYLKTISSMDNIPSPLTSMTSPAATRQDVSTPGVGLDLSIDHAMSLVDSFMANANNKNPIFNDGSLRALVKQSWQTTFRGTPKLALRCSVAPLVQCPCLFHRRMAGMLLITMRWTMHLARPFSPLHSEGSAQFWTKVDSSRRKPTFCLRNT